MVKRFIQKHVCLSIFISVLLFIYLFGAFLFSFLLPFRCYIKDTPVSCSLVSDALMKHVSDVQNDCFVFYLRGDVTQEARLGDLGIFEIGSLSQDIKRPSGFLWPLSIFRDTVFETEEHYDWDIDALREGLSCLTFMSEEHDVKPISAKVSIKDDGSFEVIPAFDGTSVDFDRLLYAVCQQLSMGKLCLDLDQQGCYVREHVIHEDLKFLCSDLKKIQDSVIYLNMGCGAMELIPRNVIDACVYEKGGDLYLDYDLFFDYFLNLKKKYDTIGKSRYFVTSKNERIELPVRNTDTFYGWDMDVDRTMAEVCSRLLSGGSGTVDVHYYHKGLGHGQDHDLGDSYIELSIQDQHMWLYLDGELDIDTDVTTGKDEPRTRTPLGLFHTMDFNTEYQMHGWYGSAFSHYFIRVTPEGVGIHDASWRDEYGGDHYILDGSHGCINTPFEAVKHIYHRLLEYNNGMELPVIIY